MRIDIPSHLGSSIIVQLPSVKINICFCEVNLFFSCEHNSLAALPTLALPPYTPCTDGAGCRPHVLAHAVQLNVPHVLVILFVVNAVLFNVHEGVACLVICFLFFENHCLLSYM